MDGVESFKIIDAKQAKFIENYTYFLYFAQQSSPPPQWARVSSFTQFLDHTQRRSTVGRNPLDE